MKPLLDHVNVEKPFGLSVAEAMIYGTLMIAFIEDPNRYAFCANTNNLAPDWETTNILITPFHWKTRTLWQLHLVLEAPQGLRIIISKGANLLKSATYWLFKPNDESRQEENNVLVAVELANSLGVESGKSINNMN